MGWVTVSRNCQTCVGSGSEEANPSLTAKHPQIHPWVQPTPCGAVRKLCLAPTADQQNWEQISGSYFKPFKITRFPLCLSLFLWARVETGWINKAQLHGRRQHVEESFWTETKSVFCDQERSNNGWWASHLESLWLNTCHQTSIRI